MAVFFFFMSRSRLHAMRYINRRPGHWQHDANIRCRLLINYFENEPKPRNHICIVGETIFKFVVFAQG